MQHCGGNLFANLSTQAGEERFEQIAAGRGVLIERIVSTGQASPAGFWYDDPRDEWGAVLAGSAVLEFEGDASVLAMAPGDYVLIPAHCRHRVHSTDASCPTVWLAIYLDTAP